MKKLLLNISLLSIFSLILASCDYKDMIGYNSDIIPYKLEKEPNLGIQLSLAHILNH